MIITYSFLQTSLHILLEMADSAILPYNLERFPKAMQDSLDTFDKNNITDLLKEGGGSLNFVKKAVQDFAKSTKTYMKELQNVKENHDPMKMRIVNDQMMQLERLFNMPNGLPG